MEGSLLDKEKLIFHHKNIPAHTSMCQRLMPKLRNQFDLPHPEGTPRTDYDGIFNLLQKFDDEYMNDMKQYILSWP